MRMVSTPKSKLAFSGRSSLTFSLVYELYMIPQNPMIPPQRYPYAKCHPSFHCVDVESWHTRPQIEIDSRQEWVATLECANRDSGACEETRWS